MAKEQDVVQLPFRITEFNKDMIVALDRNFKEIEQQLSMLQLYIKAITGGSVKSLTDVAKIWDRAENINNDGTFPVTSLIGQLVEEQIANSAISASKINASFLIVSGDTWTDNSPVTGEIAWNEHAVFWNGVKYTIAAGHTAQKYVYWDSMATIYGTSDTMPNLSDTGFLMAINNSGEHQIVWKQAIAKKLVGEEMLAEGAVTATKIANAAIGSAAIAEAAILSAHIQNAAIQTAHIDDLAVTSAKIKDITADKVTIGPATTFAPGYDPSKVSMGVDSDCVGLWHFDGSLNSHKGVAAIGDNIFDAGCFGQALSTKGTTNLLQYPNDFDNAVWEKTNAIVTPNQTTAPDGTLTADKINITGNLTSNRVLQRKSKAIANGNQTNSIWLKADTAKIVRLYIYDNNGAYGAYTDCNLTTSWQRFSVTGGIGVTTTCFFSITANGSTTPGEFYAWGAQMEENPYVTPFVDGIRYGFKVPTADLPSDQGSINIRVKNLSAAANGSVLVDVPKSDNTQGLIAGISNATGHEGEVCITDLDKAFTYTETTQADFNLGTLVDVVAASTGDLKLITTDTVIIQQTNYSGLVANRGSVIREVGQTFTPSSALSKVAVEIYVGVATVPLYSLTGKIYATSGGLPTGSALATAIVTHTATGWARFEFTVNLSAATMYAFTVCPTQAESTDLYSIYGDGGQNLYAGGTVVTWSGSVWSTLTAWDLAFKIIDLTKYKTIGTREKIIDLSGAIPAGGTLISWVKTTPTNTTLTVETALSIDGGSIYTNYAAATSGSAIPGITASTDLTNARLKIKETLATTDTSVTPQLNSLTFTIWEKQSTTVYGPNKSTLTAWDSISLAWSTTRLSLVVNEAEACYIENPGLPTAFGSYAYIGTDRNSANAINTLVDELRIDKVYKDVATRTAWHKAGSPFFTSEDMVQLPGYLKAETDGWKVYDSSNALRVLIGSWIRDLERKYGIKIIEGEFYSSFFQTGLEGETRGIIKIDREFLEYYPDFSWGNISFNDSAGNLAIEMTTAADAPRFTFYLDGVRAGELKLSSSLATDEITLSSERGLLLSAGTGENIKLGATGGTTTDTGVKIYSPTKINVNPVDTLNMSTSSTSGYVTVSAGYQGTMILQAATIYTDDLEVTGTVAATGDVTAHGAKPAMQPTINYGTRYLYAVEASEVLYYDRGVINLQNGECTIKFDPIFVECIEPDTPDTPWLIWCECYGENSVYVSEIGADYFKIKERNGGTSDNKVIWKFEGNRAGYANFRLMEVLD